MTSRKHALNRIIAWSSVCIVVGAACVAYFGASRRSDIGAPCITEASEVVMEHTPSTLTTRDTGHLAPPLASVAVTSAPPANMAAQVVQVGSLDTPLTYDWATQKWVRVLTIAPSGCRCKESP